MNSGGVARDGSHATLTKTTFYQIPATMSRFGSFQADQSKIGFKVDGAQSWYYLAERNGINSLSGLGLNNFIATLSQNYSWTPVYGWTAKIAAEYVGEMRKLVIYLMQLKSFP